MEITREKYLEALEIIDLYHRISQDEDRGAPKNKTLIKDFLKMFKPENPSQTRLFNVLKKQSFEVENQGFGIRFLEDLEPYHLIGVKNIGQSSIDEFKEIKREFLQKIIARKLGFRFSG